MMSLEIAQYLLPFAIVVGVGAVLHGFTGFGFGLVSMSAFSLLGLPMERASSLLTVVSIPLLVVFAVAELRRARPRTLPTLLVLIGMVIGVPIGYAVIFRYGGTALFSLGFGLFVLGVALWRLTKVTVSAPIAVGWGPLFGFVGGFIGGAVVSGGPAVVVYLYANSEDPRDQKAALQLVFLSASLVRLVSVGQGAAGLSWELVVLGILISPIPILIILLTSRFSRAISVERFKQVTYFFLLLIGVAMLLQAVLRLE
jgi:hypothetical protein